VAWTELTELLRAALPYFSMAIWVPLVLRVLRAYERYLDLLGTLEKPRKNGLNGSGE